MFNLNQTIRYAPNRGRWVQNLKTSEILSPKIVVNVKGLGFQIRYPDPIGIYKLTKATNEIMKYWKNDPLQLYICCVNFAVFCATSGLGIALEHFKGKDPLVASIIRFHMYYHVRRILFTLKVKLPSEKNFKAIGTDYDKEA